MPPSNFKRKWIKLWIDECLTGTIREEVTPQERSVWYDFLLLAGRNRPPGCISANETTALPPKRLASILNIPISLLASSTKKFEDSGRIMIDEPGVIHITNWEKYQYTDYDRQKPYRQAKKPENIKEHEEELARQKAHQEAVSKMTSEELQADAKRLGEEWDQAHKDDPGFDEDGNPVFEKQEMRKTVADWNTTNPPPHKE